MLKFFYHALKNFENKITNEQCKASPENHSVCGGANVRWTDRMSIKNH